MTAAVFAAAAVLLLATGRRPPPRRRPEPTDRGVAPDRRAPADRSDRAAQWDRFLDAVAADVRSGAALRQAVRDVASARCPTHPLAAPMVDFDHPPHTHDADLAVVWQVLAAAATFGGATAATVQSGANLLRERAAVRAEARAHSAQARLSARVLTFVPLGFAGWSAVASSAFRRALGAPLGLASAAAGLVMNAIGWWWMRRIVHRASA